MKQRMSEAQLIFQEQVNKQIYFHYMILQLVDLNQDHQFYWEVSHKLSICKSIMALQKFGIIRKIFIYCPIQLLKIQILKLWDMQKNKKICFQLIFSLELQQANNFSRIKKFLKYFLLQVLLRKKLANKKKYK